MYLDFEGGYLPSFWSLLLLSINLGRFSGLNFIFVTRSMLCKKIMCHPHEAIDLNILGNQEYYLYIIRTAVDPGSTLE